MIDLKKDFVTKSGLRAAIYFIHGSHYCGYVGVNKDHPLSNVNYGDHCEILKDSPDCFFIIHGGLTFSGEIKTDTLNNLWWFGFDCAHAGDKILNQSLNFLSELSFLSELIFLSEDDIFRDIEYVEKQCESLACQLSKIEE